MNKPPTTNSRMDNLHESVIKEIDLDINRLEDEIEQLKSVRQYHLHKLGKALKIESEIIESNLFNEEDEGWSELTRHDACKRVLWEADEALGMPAILDRLREAGYQTHLKRQKLSNACYTALDRKKDMFTKKGQKWGLAEWDDSFWES